MKPSIKQYALSLYSALIGKDVKEQEAVIKDFVSLLGRNGDFFLAEKIIERFEKVFNENEGIYEAQVFSARELPAKDLDFVKDFIKKESGAEKIILSKAIDEDILGGFVVKFGDKILDASLLKNIDDLKVQMQK